MENIGDKDLRKLFQLIFTVVQVPRTGYPGRSGVAEQEVRTHTQLWACACSRSCFPNALWRNTGTLFPPQGQTQGKFHAGDLGRSRVGSLSSSSFLCRMGTASLGAAPSLCFHSTPAPREGQQEEAEAAPGLCTLKSLSKG